MRDVYNKTYCIYFMKPVIKVDFKENIYRTMT